MSLLGRIKNPEGLAGIIAKYLTFLSVLTIISIVLSVVGGIIIVVNPEISIFGPDESKVLNLGKGIQYSVGGPATDYVKQSRCGDLILIVSSIIYLVATWLVLRWLTSILRSMAKKRPFDQKNPKRISYVALVVILSGFVSPWLDYCFFRHEFHLYNLKSFLVRYRPDINTIFLGLLLLVLAGAFAHGCYLQREVDETL